MTNSSYSEPKNHAYMASLQGLIGRMNSNSLGCKIFCSTIVAAVTAATDVKGMFLFFTCAVIIGISVYLDALYLSMERVYVNKYNDFLSLMRDNDTYKIDDVIFDLNPGNYQKLSNVWATMHSWSIKIPYVAMFIFVSLATYYK